MESTRLAPILERLLPRYSRAKVTEVLDWNVTLGPYTETDQANQVASSRPQGTTMAASSRHLRGRFQNTRSR
jgi:hypothetical protein